jgi:hypothetical protein
MMVASTVLLQTPQVLAVSRLLWLHNQTRRRISRIFRMVTRSLGILPSFNEIEDGKIPRGGYPATTLSFVLAVFTGMVAAFQSERLAVFPSEWWPFSRRNAGRFRPEYAKDLTFNISERREFNRIAWDGKLHTPQIQEF